MSRTHNDLNQLIDADGELICETCHQARPFECFPDCDRCLVAVAIANGKWGTLEKLYNGASWMVGLRREHRRQTEALAMLSRACA